MTNTEKQEVFQAQVNNVRKLDSSFKTLMQTINACLRKNNMHTAESHTLLAALVFTALSEAQFSKLIHTPYAFELSEVSEIKRQKSISDKWKKAVSIAISKIAAKPKYKKNLLQQMERLINTHITKPSEIRNKIAHGQWATALNSGNTKVNTDLTSKITSIDCVEVLKWKKTYEFFYKIVNDIAQSPNKAHFKDYYVHITELESYLKDTKNHSLEGKIAALKAKKDRSTSQNRT